MYLKKIYCKVVAVLFPLSFLFLSCTDEESPPASFPVDELEIKMKFSSFIKSDPLSDKDEYMDKVNAYLFEDGVLKKVWHSLSQKGGQYVLTLEHPVGRLYAVAGEDDIEPELDGKNLEVDSLTEEEWIKATVSAGNGRMKHYATGQLDLPEKGGQVSPLLLVLDRGVARFDLQIETGESIEVNALTLQNAMQRTYCFPQPSVTIPEGAEKGSYKLHFDPVLTVGKEGVMYVYEQFNPELIAYMDVTVDGEAVRLETKLPEEIKRNAVYVVNVRRGETGVMLDIEEWNEEDLDLDVPLNGLIKIDPASVLPDGVEIADGGSTLKLPYQETEFEFAVDCDNELELVSVEGSSLLRIEAVPQKGINQYKVRKPLYVPNHPQEEVFLRFRRKGLANAYPEDYIRLSVAPNPVTISGLLTFEAETYTCDFGRYIDNELGVVTLPPGKRLSVEFDQGEDPWIRIDERNTGECRVVAGWKPNDKTANGRVQLARLVISNQRDGSEREEYVVKRRNYGLPVTWFHGIWWCKYNAKGNSRSFDDQVLSSADPAAMAGKTVAQYLASCPSEDFLNLWKWEYQGDSGQGMEVIDENGKLVLKGYNPKETVHINKLPAGSLSPDGYELPSMEDFNRVFDATDYVWVMWNGSHQLKNPWEGHSIVKREQQRRNGLQIGNVAFSDVIMISMYSPDFPEHEAITWYGAAAQWNSDGVLHEGHYNNILFGVCSPEGNGWYISGGMKNLYLHKNGAGTKDTRILRFKKSPVEYIYGDGG